MHRDGHRFIKDDPIHVMCMAVALVQVAIAFACSVSWRCLQASWLFGSTPLPAVHQWILGHCIRFRSIEILACALLLLGVVLLARGASRMVLLYYQFFCILYSTGIVCVTFVALMAMAFPV